MSRFSREASQDQGGTRPRGARDPSPSMITRVMERLKGRRRRRTDTALHEYPPSCSAPSTPRGALARSSAAENYYTGRPSFESESSSTLSAAITNRTGGDSTPPPQTPVPDAAECAARGARSFSKCAPPPLPPPPPLCGAHLQSGPVPESPRGGRPFVACGRPFQKFPAALGSSSRPARHKPVKRAPAPASGSSTPAGTPRPTAAAPAAQTSERAARGRSADGRRAWGPARLFLVGNRSPRG